MRLSDLKAIPISDKRDKSKIWWLFLSGNFVSIYPVYNSNSNGVASYMINMIGGQTHEVRDETDKQIITDLVTEYEKDYNFYLETKKQEKMEQDNKTQPKAPETNEMPNPEPTTEGLDSKKDDVAEEDAKGDKK